MSFVYYGICGFFHVCFIVLAFHKCLFSLIRFLFIIPPPNAGGIARRFFFVGRGKVTRSLPGLQEKDAPYHDTAQGTAPMSAQAA